MNRRLIGLAVAIVLALVATGLLVQYVRTADERARVDEQLAEVFVAQEDITPGTTADAAIGQGLITTSQVPARAVPSGAVADLGRLSGQIVTVPIYAGEIIVAQRFGQTVAQSTGLLQIPEGTQAVTVEAGTVSGLAGYIQPGNTVSVLGSLAVPLGAFDDDVFQDTTVESGGAAAFQTQYLVQNATVLAIGRRVVQEEEGEDPRHIFTLAMPPEDIERIVFMTQRGGLWFTLVPEPDDEDEEFDVVDTPGRRVSDAQE